MRKSTIYQRKFSVFQLALKNVSNFSSQGKQFYFLCMDYLGYIFGTLWKKQFRRIITILVTVPVLITVLIPALIPVLILLLLQVREKEMSTSLKVCSKNVIQTKKCHVFIHLSFIYSFLFSLPKCSDKQLVYLDPEVVDNDTGIVLVNKTVDVPFQVQQESRNLYLPEYMFQQSTNVGKKGALISTKESDSSMTLVSLDATKHCTQPTVSHRTEDAVVTLSSERQMINFITLKELLILREQCVKRKVQVNGHTQNDAYLMMELYQYGRGRQFGFERTRHGERSREMIKIDTSFQKEDTHEGAISNIPRSPIGLIASVSLRKQEKTLEIIRGITRNGSRARRQMVKVFHKQLHTWTETEIASTLYIVWTNAGILD